MNTERNFKGKFCFSSFSFLFMEWVICKCQYLRPIEKCFFQVLIFPSYALWAHSLATFAHKVLHSHCMPPFYFIFVPLLYLGWYAFPWPCPNYLYHSYYIFHFFLFKRKYKWKRSLFVTQSVCLSACLSSFSIFAIVSTNFRIPFP